MNKEEYKTYLFSEHWINKKREFYLKNKKAKNKLCVNCKGNKELNVHHKTYINIGKEDVEKDLLLLCRDCHYRLHKTEFKNRKTKKKRSKTFLQTYKFLHNEWKKRQKIL